MLARPTPQQAFANRYAAVAQYFAQHAVWYQWAQTGSALWAAAPTLDAPGLLLAEQITRRAAWVLDGLLANAPADVGIWLAIGPAVTAAWETWQQIALQPVPGTPTHTLRFEPAADSALQALLAWDPIRGHRTPPSPETTLIALLQGLAIVPSPAVPATNPQILWHTLSDQDTLLGLATRYLHNPEAWPQIRRLNALHAPYISPRLWDVYGPPIVDYTLLAVPTDGAFLIAPLVNAGVTQVILPGVPAPLCPPGSIIVLEQWIATGRQQEAHPVIAYDAATFTATLATPTQAAYTAGALMSLNFNPQVLTTQVLMPGQGIQIPRLGSQPLAALPDPQDPLGTDLYLSPDGNLQWTATGDLQIATGILNLQGALSRRLAAYLGTLPLHPYHYGSGLPSLLGQPMGHAQIVRGYVRMALLPDPRVAAVNPVTVVQDGTIWRITATVQIHGLPEPVTIAANLAQEAV